MQSRLEQISSPGLIRRRSWITEGTHFFPLVYSYLTLYGTTTKDLNTHKQDLK